VHKTLWHTPALFIHVPEGTLGERVPLLGGPTPPLDRLGIILRDAPALVIHVSQTPLRAGIALGRSILQPLDGLRIILWDALALRIEEAQERLGFGVALGRDLLQRCRERDRWGRGLVLSCPSTAGKPPQPQTSQPKKDAADAAHCVCVYSHSA